MATAGTDVPVITLTDNKQITMNNYNWTNFFWLIIYIIDIAMFLHAAITVAYMAVFAIAAAFHKRSIVPHARKQNRFIIIIPALSADRTVRATVHSVLSQVYPQRMFDVVVVSDMQDEMTNFHLAQMPITLLNPQQHNTTKIAAIQYAIKNMPAFKLYDAVILLDADTIVDSDFLEHVNDAYVNAGTKVIQLHCAPQNRNTDAARLDAIFEEINNNIFRLGHICLGYSSALASSGSVYDYEWLRNTILKMKPASNEKDLEMEVLKQNIYVDYFDDIKIYDEKASNTGSLNRQRGHYVSSQFFALLKNLRYLPKALLRRQHDIIDKLLQWWIIPRTPVVSLITLMSILMAVVYMSLAVKWWILGAVILFVFAIATPDYLVDKNFDRSFRRAPIIMLYSLLSVINPFKPREGK